MLPVADIEARRAASRYRQFEFDDLRQVARLTLVELASSGYRGPEEAPDAGFAISIRHRLLDHVRRHAKTLRKRKRRVLSPEERVRKRVVNMAASPALFPHGFEHEEGRERVPVAISTAPNPEEALAERDAAEKLELKISAALARLRPARDAAVLRAWIAGETMKAIARRHRISEPRVSQLIKRARSRLRLLTGSL